MKYLFLIAVLFSYFAHAQQRSLVINECMPNNTNTVADQDGEYNDWVELYNNSSNSLNLNGYFLSDRKSEPTKFAFPSLQLNSDDYLIVWLDKDTLQQGLHTNFKLSASSEQLYLFDVDTHLVDYVHFYNVDPDISIARNTDASGSFRQSDPTFNQTNGNKDNGIVINEWMANNTDGEPDEYGEYNDWIELYNNSSEAINLTGYFLSNKANEATKYKFPNILIDANDYLVLWADEDTLQGDLHLSFKLDSERDDILFSRPDTSTIDYFFHADVDSNISICRIPNANGDLALGLSTFESTNLPYLNVIESLEQKLLIYPNPCTSSLYLENIDNKLNHIELLDVTGKTLANYNLNSTKIKIDVSNYKTGIYFLKMESNKFHKVIIVN